MVIQDEPHAIRLARAILSDVELYNADTIRGATISVRRAVAEQIEEGRAIFRTRVSEECASVFDRELITWMTRMRPDLADEPDFIVAPRPAPESEPRSAEQAFARERERSVTDPISKPNPLPLLLAVTLLVVATSVWWFLRH